MPCDVKQSLEVCWNSWNRKQGASNCRSKTEERKRICKEIKDDQGANKRNLKN